MRGLQPGEVFLERYEIVSVMGEGGHGVVYEGLDPAIDRRVAIKVVRPDLDAQYSPQVRERFRREAAAVANLRDPHTVTLLDYGESADGLLYLVFEFVDGRPLHEVLRSQGALEPEAAVDLLRQVLQSLREAHAAGILHRDVKPDNIIVYSYMGDPFRAKLVDFGLAKRSAEGDPRLTQEGIVLGTARYVSPEAYLGQEQSPASDIFSLGLVFFELLTGRWANEADGMFAIAEEQVSPNEFHISDQVPDSLRNVLARMIRKRPEQRFQSAQEVLHALEVVSPRGSTAGGGMRELTIDDFAEGRDASLEVAQPVETVRPVLTSASDVSAGGARSHPGTPKSGGGVARFAVGLTLLLLGASAGAVHFLDLEMPWNEPTPPVNPADLPPKVFSLDAPTTAGFYVDFERGIVLASNLGEVTAEGRCAFLLDDRSNPAPAGVFYFADLVELPDGPVTAEPIGREAVAERATLCATAGDAAWDAVQSAEILAGEIRITQLERKRDKRVQVRESTARVEKRSARDVHDEKQKQKLIKMLIQRGTGLPLDLLSR